MGAKNEGELRLASRLIRNATRGIREGSTGRDSRVSDGKRATRIEASLCTRDFSRGFFHPFSAVIARPRLARGRGILVLISQELLTYDGIEQLAGLGL